MLYLTFLYKLVLELNALLQEERILPKEIQIKNSLFVQMIIDMHIEMENIAALILMGE